MSGNGKVLTHEVNGEGEGVLLLNGGMMTLAAWGEIALGLSENHKVVRYDLRGQLRSPGTPPDTLHGHVADVVALLDHLGLERVHLVGTSYGAEVGLLFAALRPRRALSVAAITAADLFDSRMSAGALAFRRACEAAAAGGDKTPVWDMLVASAFSDAWRDANREVLEARKARTLSLLPAWYAAIARLVAPLEDLDLTPFLKKVECPVLSVIAGLDRTIPRERAEALASAVPNGRFVVIPGAGHAVVTERPAEVLGMLRVFLDAWPKPVEAPAPAAAAVSG